MITSFDQHHQKKTVACVYDRLSFWSIRDLPEDLVLELFLLAQCNLFSASHFRFQVDFAHEPPGISITIRLSLYPPVYLGAHAIVSQSYCEANLKQTSYIQGFIIHNSSIV